MAKGEKWTQMAGMRMVLRGTRRHRPTALGQEYQPTPPSMAHPPKQQLEPRN